MKFLIFTTFLGAALALPSAAPITVQQVEQAAVPQPKLLKYPWEKKQWFQNPLKWFQNPLKGPVHASCKMTVKIAGTGSCQDVSDALTLAAKSMSGFDKCGSGEKCGYSITSASASSWKGVHETPGKHYKDDLTFSLSSGDDGCAIQASSSSETFYAVLDQGTNYCNLHNLLAATGMNFQETVSDKTCTQYSSANCDKY